MGPQRENCSKDISWRDLGRAIEKACLDSSGVIPDDDRKMPAKKLPPKYDQNEDWKSSSKSVDYVDGRFSGGNLNPRRSMKMQMRKKHDRLRQCNNVGDRNLTRSHSIGEDEISWRDLTQSIEKAKLNSSLSDVNELSGELGGSVRRADFDGQTTIGPGGMFESFKNLDEALKQAMKDSLAKSGTDSRAAYGSEGKAVNGATLFESFRNLDDAMAQAVKNSLIDYADGYGCVPGRAIALETMEEEDENTACVHISLADNGGGNGTLRAKNEFTHRVPANTSRGGRNSSIASIKDTSGDNLDQIQQQLQGFSWSRDSDEESDGAGLDKKVETSQKAKAVRKLSRISSTGSSSISLGRKGSLDSTSSNLDHNPASSRPVASASKHNRRDSKESINSDLSCDFTASGNAAGRRSSLNRRVSRSTTAGNDNQNSISTGMDHSESSKIHNSYDLNCNTRKCSLSDELESTVPTLQKKKKPGRIRNALSSSVSSPSREQTAVGSGRLTSSVVISSSSELQGQSIHRNNSDESKSDEAIFAKKEASRLHYGELAHSGSITSNLEAPTAPAKKKVGFKKIFGRSKAKNI
mmetsp:Transcript_29513/g.58834  ORF Transcript_29513/g.58834 Transcript_29513/m.58834 type:complete len:581 (-) Transcript_29513:49-1791(-)